MKYILLSNLLICCFALTRCAQRAETKNNTKIDQIFRQFDSTNNPGCAVAVIQNGKVIHNKGYGLANLEYDIPITSTSVFDIASVSKQFAGLAISTLIQEGKINLDDDIRKYIPEVPDFGKTITIRHLVHHTSGLRDWPSTLRAAGWRWDETFSFADILRMVKQQKELDFIPGERYSYSNTGYNLLAVLVEKVSGKSFKQWTLENIFQPLGMNSSAFLDDASRVIKNMAYSYFPADSGYSKASTALTAVGSSSLFTSVDDLIIWVLHFNNQIREKDPVYLRMLDKGLLNNKDTVHYGFGLGLDKRGPYQLISHTGGWAGYRTVITNYPEVDLSIIILANRSDFNPSNYGNQIADLFIEPIGNNTSLADTIQKLPPVSLDTNLAKKYTGMFKLGNGWYVTLTLENGQMMTQANGESKFPMTPKSPADFWIDAYGASMKFLTNQDGGVDTLIYKTNRAPRINPLVPGADQMNIYAGIYSSEELSTAYNIDTDGQKLWLHHFRLGDMELMPDPVTPGLFNSDLGRIEFDQVNGKITGLRLSGGRIRNIRFERK